MKRLGQHAFKPEDAEQLDPELVKACAADRFKACETMLKVSDKDGVLVPCKLRDLYRLHYEASGDVVLSLKSRQEFETTSWDAMFYMDIVEHDGIKVLALNLTEKKAQENFRRVKAFESYRHPILKELTPPCPRPTGSSWPRPRATERRAGSMKISWRWSPMASPIPPCPTAG